jgi:ABC-type spermidine/putrescine transport system permease subunit II
VNGTATTAQRRPLPIRSLLVQSAWVRRRDRKGFWFVAPFLVVFAVFLLAPLIYAIYTSLYTTRIIGGTTFTGAANYTETLQSGEFWSGVIRVIIFAAIQIPVMLAVAFFFATMFDLGVARYGSVFRTIFFIPFAVPAVVGAVMWSFLLEPQFGPFVHLAHALGFAQTDFFSSNLILPSIIVIVIWEWTGYNMIILYAALKSVPRDVVEAAILDDTPLWKIILKAEGQAADRPSGHRAAGVHQHDRRAAVVHRAADPAVLRDPGHLNQLHADAVHLQHRDRGRADPAGRGRRGDPRPGDRGHLGQLAVPPPPQG